MTLSVSTHTPVAASYQEMVARLKKDELQALTTKMDHLTDKDCCIEQLCSSLSSCTLNDEIFTATNLPYYALEAFRLHHINEYQFGTLQLLWSIGQCHNGFDEMQVIPLFTQDGQPNSDAIKMIQHTLDGFIPITISIHERLRFLTDDELVRFIDEMKKLPISEQRFFVVPEIQYPYSTISHNIRTSTGINIFNALAGGYRMIPSLGMMQTILNVKYGLNAVKINPVLGVSTLSQLEKEDARDMAVPYPGVFLPDAADHYAAPWYEFSYHDFYHAILCSGFPKVYRQLMFAVASLAVNEINVKHLQSGTTTKRTYQAFRFAALDMETSNFRSERSLISTYGPEALFWLEIHALALKVFNNPCLAQFDVKTVENFYQKIAHMLLVDGKANAAGLTTRSLKKADSILRSHFTHPIMQLRLLRVMSKYVKAHERKIDSKSLIPLRVQVQIASAKMIIQKNLDYQKAIDPLQTLLSQESIQTLPKETSENDRYTIAVLLLAGASLKEYLSLTPIEREHISERIESLLPLMLAGVSLQQTLQLQQNQLSKDTTDIIFALLEIGTSWQQVLQFLNRNTLSYESKQVVLSLLKTGANLDEIQRSIDNSTIWQILVRHKANLEHLADKRVIGKNVLQLQPPFLEEVFTHPHRVIFLLKAGCKLEELATYSLEFFEQMLSNYYNASQLIRAGVTLSQLGLLHPSSLDKALTSSYLDGLIKAGMPFDELIKPEYDEKFQLIISRFFHVQELLKAGVSPRFFIEVEMPVLQTLFEKSFSAELVCLQLPFDWLIDVSLTEPNISNQFFYLAYLVKNGKASVSQLLCLSKEKLALLLNKLKEADDSHHTLDSVEVELYLQK